MRLLRTRSQPRQLGSGYSGRLQLFSGWGCHCGPSAGTWIL
ncbi:hypothetical protein C4K25_6040 [Pseudomonas chlororaphis]|nr:hypothetical protein C4K25_6040 [Pseudomonas chlororaphis]